MNEALSDACGMRDAKKFNPHSDRASTYQGVGPGKKGSHSVKQNLIQCEELHSVASFGPLVGGRRGGASTEGELLVWRSALVGWQQEPCKQSRRKESRVSRTYVRAIVTEGRECVK